MQKTYTETITLRTCQCDMYGEWKPSAILETMQETAGAHSALLGLSRPVMEQMGVAWVLSRVKVVMERLPRFGETITVRTWPTPNRHMFFPRTHVFEDANGNQIGCANSLWVLMDVPTRRITRSDAVLSCMPDNRDLPTPAGMPSTVRALAQEALASSIMPAYVEFDINGHVNNTRYMDWCMNALGMERLEKNRLLAIDVNYDAEILPGVQVRAELTTEEDHFAFLGFEGDKQHFAVSGVLKARK